MKRITGERGVMRISLFQLNKDLEFCMQGRGGSALPIFLEIMNILKKH
jgi:hypothetical protein